MAKLKKTARTSSARKTASGTAKDQAQADRLGKSITESAQQIWLAGMGAFNRAQAEGGKLFESLVRDGLSLEQTARKLAGNRANVVRDVVEGRVGQARERAVDTWDKLEKVFEDRVQRALVKLGVPGRDDLNALTQRVERLTEEPRLLALLDRSERLYERVRHLDRRMYVEDTTIEVPNPVLSQFDRLQAAFGR